MNLGKQALVLIRFTAMYTMADTKNLPYMQKKVQYVAPSLAAILIGEGEETSSGRADE